MNIIILLLAWLGGFTFDANEIVFAEDPTADNLKKSVIDTRGNTQINSGPTTVIALEDTHFRPAK